MCVVIHKPAGIKITSHTLERCWNVNSDGAGIMYAQNDALHIHKGMMEFDEFYKFYSEHIDKDMLIHFRLASDGEINKGMTHPFLVFPGLGVMHNGILNLSSTRHYLSLHKKFSDTYAFVLNVLSKLPQDFLYNEGIVKLLMDAVDGSTLVFMDSTGKINIIGNYAETVIYEGCWFSNKYWMVDEDEN